MGYLTLANQLTILRMGLAPLLIVLVLSRELKWALAVFVVAGLTDLLDGIAARHGGHQTTLGAMLDPVADKVLLTACFIALTWGHDLPVSLPLWLTVTTLSRDAIIIISVAVVNLTSGSGDFMPLLAAPGRVTITATKTSFERNESHFAEKFVEALTKDVADVDKDGRVSLLEAYRYGVRETKRIYDDATKIQTEHSQLDDNGSRQNMADPTGRDGQGLLARRFFFDSRAASSAPISASMCASCNASDESSSAAVG